MKIRRAGPEDIARAVELAAKLGLDYPGMDQDPIWIADVDGGIGGLVALKNHPDCAELVSLGVDPRFRNRGFGRRLVEALAAGAGRDIYLATIIPGFFEGCGFRETAAAVPAGMAKDPEWCRGCSPELCTVMVRKNA